MLDCLRIGDNTPGGRKHLQIVLKAGPGLRVQLAHGVAMIRIRLGLEPGSVVHA